MFNSSEKYDVLEGNGVRLQTFDVKAGHPVHLVLTAYRKHEPVFSINRVAGRVCPENCPEQCNKEVTTPLRNEDGNQTYLSYKNTHVVIGLPGRYYLHSPEAAWMQDPCRPVIVEKFDG